MTVVSCELENMNLKFKAMGVKNNLLYETTINFKDQQDKND